MTRKQINSLLLDNLVSSAAMSLKMNKCLSMSLKFSSDLLDKFNIYITDTDREAVKPIIQDVSKLYREAFEHHRGLVAELEKFKKEMEIIDNIEDNETIEVLDAYNKFLLEHGYTDTDVYEESPTAIDKFLAEKRNGKA